MSIELSPATGVQKPSEPLPGKTRNKSDAPAEGGFAALMREQEAPPAETKKTPAPASKGDAQYAKKETAPAVTTKDDDAAKAADATALDADAALPTSPSSPSPPPATADGTTPSAVAPTDAATPAGLAGMQDLAALAAAYLQPPATGAATAQPTVAEQTLPDLAGKTESAVAGVPQSAAPRGLAGAAADVARASLADGRTAVSNLANYASVLEQLKSRLAQGGLPTDDTGLPAAGVDTGGMASAKSPAGLTLQNARLDKMLNALQAGGANLPGVAESLALATVQAEAAEALKSVDRSHGESPRGIDGLTGASADGAFGQSGFTPTVQFDGTSVTASVPGQATGEAVADQVGYWVSQGVQNAELTLDGLNAERVEVKISMSGNEAHVEFRSDQAATREMLAGSAAYLKDLLSSQGVVLSGVTVGHQSGGDMAGGQSQQSRSRGEQGGGLQHGAGAESRAVAAIPAAAALVPAGALDLFV